MDAQGFSTTCGTLSTVNRCEKRQETGERSRSLCSLRMTGMAVILSGAKDLIAPTEIISMPSTEKGSCPQRDRRKKAQKCRKQKNTPDASLHQG